MFKPLLRGLPVWLGSAQGRLYGRTATLVYAAVATNVLRLLSTVVLTRLLVPRDFGLAAIMMSVFFVLAMITDAGFEAFIVRHRDGEDPDFLDAIWSVHVARGWLMCLAAIALAIPVSHVLQEPSVAPIIAAASLAFGIDGSASLAMITALRKGLVRKLSVIDLLLSVAQVAIGIIAAFFLRNVWAIVIAMVATSLIRTGLSYALFPDSRRRFRPNWAVSRELWSFSRLIAMSSILTLVLTQVDKLVLARVFSLPVFGTYAIAANLASAPQGVISTYASRIVYPSLARVAREDPAALSASYYAGRGLSFYGFAFATGVLIGAAPLVVGLLYDARYANAGFYLGILAVATALSLLTRTASELLVASGYVRATLVQNVARIVWLVLVGGVGLWLFGANGLILALGSIEIPAYLVGAFYMMRRGLFSLRWEAASFMAIAAGGSVGWAATMLYAKL